MSGSSAKNDFTFVFEFPFELNKNPCQVIIGEQQYLIPFRNSKWSKVFRYNHYSLFSKETSDLSSLTAAAVRDDSSIPAFPALMKQPQHLVIAIFNYFEFLNRIKLHQ